MARIRTVDPQVSHVGFSRYRLATSSLFSALQMLQRNDVSPRGGLGLNNDSPESNFCKFIEIAG